MTASLWPYTWERHHAPWSPEEDARVLETDRAELTRLARALMRSCAEIQARQRWLLRDAPLTSGAHEC